MRNAGGNDGGEVEAGLGQVLLLHSWWERTSWRSWDCLCGKVEKGFPELGVFYMDAQSLGNSSLEVNSAPCPWWGQ